LLSATVLAGAPAPQEFSGRHRLLDEILDLYVRDGFVYYRALKGDRAKLDAYLAQLAAASIDKESRDEQVAFWLNAYDAIVLRTVIDHYPAPRRSNDYPARSIRQVPGAFERERHTVAGRPVTLDQIEQSIFSTFQDPRLYLAVGRGAVGGGRLRSEAFVVDRLQRQLNEVANECVNRAQCVQIERDANRIVASAIFSWRSNEFVAAYGSAADPRYSSRSPIERAILAFVQPKLLATEQEVLEKNTFQVTFRPFDWSLNDLTGR
jgi:hypothetical protein